MLLRSLYLMGMVTAMLAGAGDTVLFDFTKGIHGWKGNARVTGLKSTPEGLAFACDGEEDPWIEGPPIAVDLGTAPTRLTLRLRTDGDAGGELFYGPGFTAGRSMGVPLIADGEWHEYTIVIPPQPKNTRLRLDPGSRGGDDIVLHSIKAQILAAMEAPRTTPPKALPCDGPELVSGDLVLRHSASRWGVFELIVAGKPFARSHSNDQIGVLSGKRASYLSLTNAPGKTVKQGNVLLSMATVTDPDGVRWRFSRIFARGPDGMIKVTTKVTVDRDREVFHLPWLTLFPGLGTFGERKTQAMLPGTEYLADEPSSSEADVRGALAVRRVVDDLKLCFPLMALAHDDRYLGVSWQRQDLPAAVFDSPDRTFGSGAHLFALWHPGVGPQRLENSIAPLDAMPLSASKPLEFTYELLGGKGKSVIPAVKTYVAAHGMAELPEYEGGFTGAVDLLAHGWLDSASNKGGIWRHAVWGDRFGPQKAADAVCLQRWLAGQTQDEALAERLRESAAEGMEKTKGDLGSGVSHVRFGMLPYLLYGDVEKRLDQVAAGARQALGRFQDDGVLLYHAGKDRPDYASTHFAKHANGLASPTVNGILEACLLTNDRDLRRDALALVDKQTQLYANSVPRGAQTWECPLHTPDILASGRMVRMYTMAYQLSGSPKHLEQARYWAWTGVPFVYVDSPVEEPIGAYATIAVFGATNWRAPFWIGRPVQWCGLVYGAALVPLADLDPIDGKLWRQLATGITISGVQQTWPTSDVERQGLLPDFFFPRRQHRDGPAINPGTVGARLPEAYGKGKIFDRKVVGPHRVLIHAPGAIQVKGNGQITIDGWPKTPYRILLTGLTAQPTVTWNGKPVPVEFLPNHGAATLLVEGEGTLALR
ncbi:MAG: hypothetical protein HN380_03555 [Victivallales bacterium]|nr:hypothetical protein [Victivallales bacterium]